MATRAKEVFIAGARDAVAFDVCRRGCSEHRGWRYDKPSGSRMVWRARRKGMGNDGDVSPALGSSRVPDPEGVRLDRVIDLRGSRWRNAVMGRNDAKVSAFRSKHERELRKLVTIGCAVASCAFEGDSETEEGEMDSFVKGIMDLVERSRRASRRQEGTSGENVTPLAIMKNSNCL